jgi:hypothetical protein
VEHARESLAMVTLSFLYCINVWVYLPCALMCKTRAGRGAAGEAA